MEKLAFVSILLTVSPLFSTADNVIIPPSLWCDDPSLAKQAGVSNQCEAYNETASGKKLKVSLLYESLCPDCQLFIKQTLYPQIWKYGKDFVDIELVPYGNARHTPAANGTYDISCQHGPEECELNKLHSCVIHQLVDVSRWLPFVYCLESAMHEGVEPKKATQQCYAEFQVKASEQKKISDCISSPLGDQLQKAAADRTDAVSPVKHKFVPWILINDISLESAQIYQDVLFGALCLWYRGTAIPTSCQWLLNAAQQNKSIR